MKFRSLANRWRKTFALAAIVVGPCFLAVAAGMATYHAWFIHRAVGAPGKIVQLIRNDQVVTNDGVASHSITYTPVFQFTTPDGQHHTVQAGVSSNPPEFEVGAIVRVLFDPQSPDDAVIDSFGQLWGFPLGFTFAGIVVLAIGLGMRTFLRRRQVANDAAVVA